eukprot:SAG31_NODE_8136_length_1514_cov_1.440283_2_plen_156_part_00
MLSSVLPRSGQPAIKAASARLASVYARWLAQAGTELLPSVVGMCLHLIQGARTATSQADRELMKYTALAMRNLCVRAGKELASFACEQSENNGADGGLLAAMVSTCHSLSSGVEWDSDNACNVVYAVVMVISHCPVEVVNAVRMPSVFPSSDLYV